jgi:hypothetical protein
MAGTGFSTQDGAVQLLSAEVVEVIYTDDNPKLLYGLKVKMVGGSSAAGSNPATFTAVPLNTNIVRIPLVGEIVVLIKAPSSYSSANKNTLTTYYIDIVGLQSSINHNSIPKASSGTINSINAGGNSNQYQESSAGNTKQDSAPTIDSKFTENPYVKPLQPYTGDVIINGRFGHSIRFSSTQKSTDFKVAPNWSGGDNGNPITIIKNSAQTKDTKQINDFEVEDFTTTDNLIVMASGQDLKFEQSSKTTAAIEDNNINSWKSEKWGKTPQTLISSGRLVFNSTQQEIIAFAKNGIGLSSNSSIGIDARQNITLNSSKIELGSKATEPIILGNAFQSWVTSLINALGGVTVTTVQAVPTVPVISTPLTAAPAWPAVQAVLAQFPTVLSQLVYAAKIGQLSAGLTDMTPPTPLRAPALTDQEKLNFQEQSNQNGAKALNDPRQEIIDRQRYLDSQLAKGELAAVETDFVDYTYEQVLNHARENNVYIKH